VIKVIFHIDEMDRWPMVLKNASHFLAAEPDSQIEILANGGAVVFYLVRAQTVEPTWLDLVARGVVFKACRNALQGMQIQEQALPESVMIVPSGVVELAIKQQEGFAYIRP